jgi:hopanoid biosynthesis associated protein HpnK
LKGLIVTGDDFGAAVEINEAVESAHRDGVLTAASLMVGAPATADAVARARRMPNLRVGLHLVLVDGSPVLPASSVPDLLGRGDRFRTNIALAGASMFLLPRVRRQLAAEIHAQFEAFAATGLALDHVNAHKHFHLHPTIARLMTEIGANYALRAARVPLEPAALIASIDGRRRPLGINALAPFCLMLQSRLRATGVLVPDRVFGLAWSGNVTAGRLHKLIARLPEGLNEVYLHPATRDDFGGAVAGYGHHAELDALLDTAVVAAARNESIKLGGFADFQPGQ